MTTLISAYLRSLLRLLERLPGDEAPLESTKELSSLVELIRNAGITISKVRKEELRLQIWRPVDHATGWFMPNPDSVYAINLLKKCITTKFKVLCRTMAPSVSLCSEVAAAAETFNSAPLHSRLSFSDFVEVLVSCRSEFTADRLLRHCSQPEDIVGLARRETQFVHSIVSAFNTHSSLLDEFSTAVEPLQDTPSHLLPKHLSVKPLFPSPANNTSTTSNTFSSRSFTVSARERRRKEETLKRLVELLVVSELWKKVAVCLWHSRGGQTLRGLARKYAQLLARERDLRAAAKCLLYVAQRLDTEDQLLDWDKGFQSMLAISQRPVTGKRLSRAAETLCSEVAPPLQRMVSTTTTTHPSPQSPAERVDSLTSHHCLLSPLTLSIHAISHTLTSSLDLGLATCNLPLLAQCTFGEGPRVYRSLRGIEQDIRCSLPLAVVSEESSRGFFERKRIEVSCSTLQATFSYMCEELERTCVGFYEFLRERCRQCLLSVFPTAKQWRAVGKQRNSVPEGVGAPSRYCEVMMEQLLVPLAEAALSLGSPAQSLFMELSLTILFSEFRRIIILNKHTYSASAGRRLMADFLHLREWISSHKAGLQQDTLYRLSALPVLAEMERGLLALCGIKIPESDRDSPEVGVATKGSGGGEWVRGLSSLPVWAENAWNSPADWQECTL